MEQEISELILENNKLKLKELNLSLQSINFLPDSIGELTHLESLNLSFNRLRNLPKSIKKLTNLKRINLDENNFNKIPKILFTLKGLEVIEISNNKLDDISPEIENLKSLKVLMANQNLIEYLPDEICLLRNLNSIHLSSNKLKEIPSEIKKLTNLNKVFLFDNEISKIPNGVEKLIYLRRINLEKNKLKKIPNNLLKIKRLEYLNVKNNFIRTIPSLILNNCDPKEILNYLDSLALSGEVDYLYESKLVLVGRGFTGKTSLANKLTLPNYKLQNDLTSTEGIEIKKWEFYEETNKKKYTLNLWDFAGQEKYDATHQFFITERSIYIFVTQARQESNYLDFDYWINIIQLLSKESPIIVVQNKIDEREKKLPKIKYKEQYPFIVDFCNVSCADGYENTISDLKKIIAKALTKLPHMGDKLPKSWVDIRRELENKTLDYISYQEYLSICKKYDLNKVKADYLSKYLTDLGVIVHHIEDIKLKELVILNTDWATDGAYAVLDSISVIEKSGRFTEKELESIWKNKRYNKKRAELLRLMLNYELCFKLNQGYDYIVPELLDLDPPKYTKSIPEKNSLRFNFEYDFMPSGLLTRFIVKIHKLIIEEQFWKYGVVIKHEKTIARITENSSLKRINIIINGENKTELLAIIRKEFESIHKAFHKLVIREKIPCNCSQCSNELDRDRIYFFDYETLRNHKKNNRNEDICDYSSETVSISLLISGVILIPENQDITNINYFFNEKTKNIMKINKQKANNIINAEIIKNCNFKLDKKQDAFTQIVKELLTGDEKSKTLKAYELIKNKDSKDIDKKASWVKVQEFLIKNIEAIGQGAVGGLLTEIGKLVLMG